MFKINSTYYRIKNIDSIDGGVTIVTLASYTSQDYSDETYIESIDILVPNNKGIVIADLYTYIKGLSDYAGSVDLIETPSMMSRIKKALFG